MFYRIAATVVEATRDIDAFEELYCDYGTGVWMYEDID
jgi:hypothetical protein